MLYLMKCVLEEKGQELYHRELRVGLDSSQVNTHKEPQKVGKLLNVAARDKKTKDDIRNLATSFLEENLTKHSLSSELYKHTFPVKNTKACTSYPSFHYHRNTAEKQLSSSDSTRPAATNSSSPVCQRTGVSTQLKERGCC